MEFCCLCNKNSKTFSVVCPPRSMQIGVCIFCNYLMLCCLGGAAEFLPRRLPGPAGNDEINGGATASVYFFSLFDLCCDRRENKKKIKKKSY